MLGPAKARRLDEPIAVSLEDLVPPDHFYRHLEAKLDLGFVRDWARELYAERGRPSIDPVVFFKLQLVMFFEGIRSERKLIETASLNLAHRWYLGYALDEDAARPLQPDPHPAAARHRHLPALLRAGRRPVPGGRAGLGPGALLRRDQGAGQCRPRLPRAALLHEAKTHVADLFATMPRGAARTSRRRLPMICLPGHRSRCERGQLTVRRRSRARRAGTCWRSAGSTRTGRRIAATSARATSG